MRRDGFENVSVALDAEIEPPPSVGPGLPEVAGLVVFLGVQAWMTEIAQQVRELLSKRSLHLRRCTSELYGELFGDECLPASAFWRRP